ncbi:pentatricopeptide repeat-containing protein At2g41080 [Chenopodium quinoa]|uniref:pentatricopeptide repeat-containing protein At2g41080 n=1 Tax=Chenopodium quinoa TaxID=63459 RepID=UPI000B78C39F|nr:pentatricopeptide repeat-containing protein At2g41080 [Chenopodium quinoa]
MMQSGIKSLRSICCFSLIIRTSFNTCSTSSYSSQPLNTSSINVLTNLCSKGRIKEAFESFKYEIWSDSNLFSHLIHGCISKNSISWGKQLHAITITSGCYLDKFVNNHLLNMYGKLGELETVLVLYNVMYRKNVMSGNILINGYLQSGDIESAQKVFDEMPERNVATWNAMVTGMIQYEHNEEGLGLFSRMHLLGFSPDEFTLGSVLRGCAGLRALLCGREVHVYAIKSGHGLSLVVSNALANMYMRCRSLEEGERVIQGMPIHNVIACNTLIAGRAQNGCPEGALEQYNIMKKAGFQPDRITFVSVLSSCSELGTLGQGLQIHAEVIKRGVTAVVPLVSSLISMYSKCGCLEESIKAFMQCKDADVVLWSSMISAYGFHGKGGEAIELFKQMEQEGVEANDVTFLSLLYACSHCGLKDEGLEYLDLMVKKYGLKPRLEHYTCAVDLLGRSGCLLQAEDMIRSMPTKADAVIWKTLLSACKTHKNTEMAKRIAEEVLKLDPLDSASYVMLANIQASSKRWDEVSTVRKAMRDRRIKKEPGVSWFEFKNEVHQFTMGAKYHPRSTEIYLYLKELMSDIKECGYVPDTGSVLQDMDTEAKEQNLAQHSERLAIAFALMITPPGFPIRVMKNLRVCDDCHVAIKYISRIKDREIIVRDTSRFHHFKNGECSCSDYW